MKNKIAIPSILAAAILVAGFFVVSSNTSIDSAQAQPPAKDVVVVNSALQAVPTICPPANVQHWDKIIFTPSTDIQPNPNVNLPPLIAGKQYDIKVIDDPKTIADLEEKVIRFLISSGYLVDPAVPGVIKIIDVEYAIVCTRG